MGSAMALRAALRCKVLPQASQANLPRLAQGSIHVAPAMSRTISSMVATSFRPATTQLLSGASKTSLFHAAAQPATLAMRTYGTRSVWNVQKGRYWIGPGWWVQLLLPGLLKKFWAP